MQHFCSVSATPLNKRVWHPYCTVLVQLVLDNETAGHNAFVVKIVTETKFTVHT